MFLDKPQMPRHLTVTVASSTSVVVSWLSGFHGGSDQTFVVQYRTLHSETWRSATVLAGKQTTNERFTAKVIGLETDTVYQFRVYSTNDEGDSSHTDSVSATTSTLVSSAHFI
jgi:hypothetical protein